MVLKLPACGYYAVGTQIPPTVEGGFVIYLKKEKMMVGFVITSVIGIFVITSVIGIFLLWLAIGPYPRISRKKKIAEFKRKLDSN